MIHLLPRALRRLTFSTQEAPLNKPYPSDTPSPLGYKTALTIAGSDPSGAAGIQADLKTFSALGCYGMSVVIALTAQNTRGVTKVHPIPEKFVGEQFSRITEDIHVDAIKVGMLAEQGVIQEVSSRLCEETSLENIVVDPVMCAKSGDPLIQKEAIALLADKILPLATVLTPNIYEASLLTRGASITDKETMEKVAFDILGLGPQAVVIKGGATGKSRALLGRDCLVVKGKNAAHWLESEYTPTKNVQGTGCTFSSAIAAFLARGLNIHDAVREAKQYVTHAIIEGARYQLGSGMGSVLHFYSTWEAPNFAQQAWSQNRALYTKTLKHPFIQGLIDESLDISLFNGYIAQDFLFLNDKAKAFSILASRAEATKYGLEGYLDVRAQGDYSAAQNIFNRYNIYDINVADLQKNSVCEAYTRFLLDKATKGSFAEGLTALLPCALSYQKIGERAKPQASETHKYRLWIEAYSSVERRRRVEKFISIVDHMASEATYVERKKLHQTFSEGMEYEHYFWNSCYSSGGTS